MDRIRYAIYNVFDAIDAFSNGDPAVAFALGVAVLAFILGTFVVSRWIVEGIAEWWRTR